MAKIYFSSHENGKTCRMFLMIGQFFGTDTVALPKK